MIIMNEDTIIFFLVAGMVMSVCIIIYQQLSFRAGMRQKLTQIAQKLKEIMEGETGESVMVFTDSKELMELMKQINALLDVTRKTREDFRHIEISSKKMLSNISHDIKTPMTVVLGYLEILRLNNGDEMLARVQQKAQSVMDLVNEFFTLAKLEAGDMELALSGLDVAEICREGILDFYELLTKKEFQVAIDIPEGPVYALGDRKALHRVLSNLISNAVRYGAEGRYVGITVRVQEETVKIAVTDHGRGIEKAFAVHVFDRLYTMEDSRSRQIQGNGLGLTIARELTRQMGGELTLLSEPWTETVFTVCLKRPKTINERNS